ncbi:hypothetical protein FHX57_003937 [Paraburkholderia tropica]|uniref:hypothetical protein n=1 Tax=Paraburkholderia tropica TaxID=92647 RepID=UPI001620E594|nr:hypothetical protein [Paraburkholderia tropica]MBB3001580.1 hypothetical protein [Paraburkholderia tropica]MBB6322897.1 hypothetical protein [Paraburkholderia tropica]
MEPSAPAERGEIRSNAHLLANARNLRDHCGARRFPFFRFSAFTITAMPVLFHLPLFESFADLLTFVPAAAARRP